MLHLTCFIITLYKKTMKTVIRFAMTGLFCLVSVSLLQAQVADSSVREVKLKGAVNFRDLGGYPTKDGKKIKWDRLYRSAALNALTEEDINRMKELKLAIVLDFRGPLEIQSAPDRVIAGAKNINLPAGSETVGDAKAMQAMLAAIKDESYMTSFYGTIAPFKDRYKPMFDQLLQLGKDSALLFHCTAGKDRTGIAAALLLYALGVDETLIFEDYLATNYYRSRENERAIAGMVQMYHLDEKVARNMMAAKKEYLEATFQSIRKAYGSVEHYLRDEMGLTEARTTALKQRFLE